ncbi:MAG: hypothetical protein AAF705_07940, partial [Bacteroidota bacterium]
APVNICFSSATNTGGSSSCGGLIQGDLWYKLKVPNSGFLSLEADYGDFPVSLTALEAEVFKGSDCGSLVLFDCLSFFNAVDDDNSRFTSGLGELNNLAGEDLYLRVIKNTSILGESFQLFAVEPNTDEVPENDLCDNAIEIDLQNDICSFNVESLTTYSFENATFSGVTNLFGGQIRDIWFKVTVPNSGAVGAIFTNEFQRIPITNEVPVLSYIWYTGTGCQDLSRLLVGSSIAVQEAVYTRTYLLDNNGAGFQPGQELFVRIGPNVGEEIENVKPYFFDPTFSEGTPPNDDCSNPIPISVTPIDESPEKIGGCFNGATASGLNPAPTCIDFPGPDMWYALQVPRSGLLDLRLDGRRSLRTRRSASHAFEVYRGECEDLIPIACSYNENEGNAIEGDFQLMQLSESDGISPGETLFVRVWQPIPLVSLGFDLMAMDPDPEPIALEDLPTFTVVQKFLLALFVMTTLGFSLGGIRPFKWH